MENGSYESSAQEMRRYIDGVRTNQSEHQDDIDSIIVIIKSATRIQVARSL